MKNKFTVLFMISFVISVSSCDYDDSNDIDILTPNDSTETGINATKLSN